MADTETPETETKKPVTRRRAARKPVASKASAVTSTVKPASTSASVTPEKQVSPTLRKVAAKTALKPRSTKRSTPRRVPKPVQQTAAQVKQKGGTVAVGSRWSAAAIFGGVAVVGAAVGALLTLRGSTSKIPKAGDKYARQDELISSKLCQTTTADERAIPE
ncbi:MAG: hypothetical protein V4595_01270 [Pseudomonadota bacterium]|jgi:hypothetical protein